jgi:lipopolysaccharide transport system permease protein
MSISAPTLVIQPSKGLVRLNLRELWAYRELLYFLIWRDVKVRYKQAWLGAAWAVIQPLMTMAVFSIVFGRFGKMPSDGIPYPVFAFAALLPWQLFAHALTESGNSLVASQNLITKVYFPRLIVPLAAVLGGLVDFAIGFVVLLGLMWVYGIGATASIIVLPLFLVLALLTALAAGLWLAALNVKYRDVRHTLPFLTQFWLFATPVAYSSRLVPVQWRALLGLNPMAGVVEGFRWALLGTTPESVDLLLISVVVVLLLLAGGLVHFRRTEATFADVV